jgi:O-antigen ligase
VQTFRGEVRSSVPIHPLELALVVVACLHLCFLPWAMGTRAHWAQLISLGLAVPSFVLALWPRNYRGEFTQGSDFRLHTWPRLLRFPIFWGGLLFLGYILAAALNPAWEHVSTGIVWFIKSVPGHITWLPTSIDAPFERMNAWRVLVIMSSTWLLVCALWIGLTRRVSVHALLVVLVVNGSLLGLIAILQKMTEAKAMLWFIPPIAHHFHGTFVYKNHAGAYLNLILFLAFGLALWHHVRSLRRLERSSPAPVFAFAVIVLGASVVMSRSRAATLLLAGFLLITLIVYLVWRFRQRSSASNPVISTLLALGAVGLISAAAYFLNLDSSLDHFQRLLGADRKLSIDSRVMVRDATFELFRDQPATGWGPGSFRHAFPIHQQNYPDIFRLRGNVLFWDHAHNDWVQFLAEFGLIGAIFPVAALGWLIYRFCRLGALAHPAFLLLLLGFGLTLAHAWVDFPLSNTAIFTTFCTVWLLSLRWAELENR